MQFFFHQKTQYRIGSASGAPVLVPETAFHHLVQQFQVQFLVPEAPSLSTIHLLKLYQAWRQPRSLKAFLLKLSLMLGTQQSFCQHLGKQSPGSKPIHFYQWTCSFTRRGFDIGRVQSCVLRLPKYLPPTPLSARRVCPPRRAERGWGQYFGRRET